MRPRDIFTQIGEFQHTLGIYHTFPFDKDVLEKIREHSSGRTVVLFDYRHGDTLETNHESRVMCIPAVPKKNIGNNVFHNKLALLKGEKRCRLFVGSMNLTKESFRSPKEICCSMDIEYGSKIYNSLLDHFKQIYCFNPDRWSEIIKELTVKDTSFQQSLGGQEQENDLIFISNNDEKSISQFLLDRHLEHRKEHPPALFIVSPFLSKEFGDEFDSFLDEIKPREIHFYLRSRIPLPNQLLRRPENIRLYRPKQGSRQG